MNFDQARAVISKAIKEHQTMIAPLQELEEALKVAAEAQNEINNAPGRLKTIHEELVKVKDMAARETQRLSNDLAALNAEVANKKALAKSVEDGQKEKYAAVEAEHNKRVSALSDDLAKMTKQKAQLQQEIDKLEDARARVDKAVRQILQPGA